MVFNMGYGSYSAADWSKLKSSRKLSNDQKVEEVFKSTTCNPKFNPKFIGTRECFDSDEHPNTTPIVVGLDVTGSMGYLAVEVATGALNELITKLYSTGSVEDPALMCATYGDYLDDFPLQVSQFESDIRIAEQLLELYFENCGNGDVTPTLLWEFLSRHTNIDAINKRGQKGFVFTIGDNAEIRTGNMAETISRVIGDKIPDTTRESLLAEASEKFNIFHIMIGGNNATDNSDILVGHKISIGQDNIKAIPEIIISTIQLQKGMNKEAILEQWDEINRPVVRSAIDQLNIADNGQAISL